jgi:hypothetical protein
LKILALPVACAAGSLSSSRGKSFITPDGFEAWLAGEEPTIDRGIGRAVRITLVSPKMNKPAYNEPDCIEGLTALPEEVESAGAQASLF